MHSYQEQGCTLSLAEGLAQYNAAYPGLKRGADLQSPEAADFFRCHDIAHVIFGCDTTLPQEAVVKLSSLFGTTEGLGVIRGYQLYDSLDIYRQLSIREVLRTVVLSVWIVPRTIGLRLRQLKKWPWRDWTGLLDMSLADIRRHYGIVV